MRLDQGVCHTTYRIVKLSFPTTSLQRLAQLGIYAGARVQIEQIARQGPRLLLVRGNMMMLRKADCACIEVEESL